MVIYLPVVVDTHTLAIDVGISSFFLDGRQPPLGDGVVLRVQLDADIGASQILCCHLTLL